MLNAQSHLIIYSVSFFATLGNARAHFMNKQMYLSLIVGKYFISLSSDVKGNIF